MPILFVPFIITSLFIFLLLWWYLRHRKKSRYLLQDQTELIPAGVGHEFLKAYRDKKSYLEYQQYFTEVMQRNEVSSIYLVHGTFVGEDPFQIFDLIGHAFPRLSVELINKFKLTTKQTQNLFAKDLGNFTEEHIKYIDIMTAHKFRLHNFIWSSGNNHLARVKGALRLLDQLSQEDEQSRVLLIGHSHAGQLFALISQFINNPKVLTPLNKALENTLDMNEIKQKIKKISKMKFDFVTMGTPKRYQWKLNKQMRLLHFINHRGESVLGGEFSGAIRTHSGDYIQQWGITGSDIRSPISAEHLINLELDKILGEGSNIELLKEKIVLRHRLHEQGFHLLVDYQDNSKYPNFLKTIFGHGVYTKYDYLTFHIDEICKRLYK